MSGALCWSHDTAYVSGLGPEFPGQQGRPAARQCQSQRSPLSLALSARPRNACGPARFTVSRNWTSRGRSDISITSRNGGRTGDAGHEVEAASSGAARKEPSATSTATASVGARYLARRHHPRLANGASATPTTASPSRSSVEHGHREDQARRLQAFRNFDHYWMRLLVALRRSKDAPPAEAGRGRAPFVRCLGEPNQVNGDGWDAPAGLSISWPASKLGTRKLPGHVCWDVGPATRPPSHP